MKRLTVTLFWIIVHAPVFLSAQNIEWNTSPKIGFVFQISNNEAEKLLTTSAPDSVFHGLLHTQVDTFDIAKGWTQRPDKGHFILARISENKLLCEYAGVLPYQVFLLKEYDALSLQVVDREGNVREDAVVKLRVRRIRIDRQSKTYRLENNWFYGNDRTVTVELDGFRSVFHVVKTDVPRWYGNNYYNDGPSFYSYLITDKNKYRPGEKVRFKSYALTGSRQPLNRDLRVRLYNQGKTTIVGTVSAHRPGSFAGEFVLHDSLKLTLDVPYSVALIDKSGQVVSQCSLKYEDYELSGNKLDVRLSDTKHFYPNKNELFITASDVNGLMLKDATATVIVRTMNIGETFQPLTILRDTLMNKEVTLDPGAPTIVDIPSELFQESNTSYDVTVILRNTQNQVIEAGVSAKHYYSQYELTTKFSNDSILYELMSNGVPVDHVPMKLWYNEDVDSKEVWLPYKERINATVTTVSLKGEKISKKITIADLLPHIDLKGGIEKDSFNIRLENPQQLEVSWYVYQGSELLQKGFGKEIDYRSRIEDRTLTYYVELLYSFGGADRIKRKDYEFREDRLLVSLDIPDRAYPGQEVEALIHVTNEEGNPVSGVDLTALGANAKLNYSIADLPYYGDNSAPRSKKETYSKDNMKNRAGELTLDYKRWEKKAGLDTMKYYQFTYPGPKPFVHEVTIADGTQFAPYVMKNGIAIDIYVIELNRQPVYFSWANQPEQYSFYVPVTHKSEVTLRLFDRVLIFDSLSFTPGKKTILSVDIDHLPSGVRMHMIPLPAKNYKKERVFHSFTSIELNRYLGYVSSFARVDGNAWLTYGSNFIPLFSRYIDTSQGSIMAGPIVPGMYTFHASNKGINTTYRHTGGYSYAFEDNIVYKTDAKKLIPERLFLLYSNPMTMINDLAMTKDRFLEERPEGKWHTRIIEMIDRNTHMKVLLPAEKESSGLAAFLFEDTRTKKLISPCKDIQSSNKNYFTIPLGLHNIIVIYNNGTYLKMDSILLQSNTQVVADLNSAQLHGADQSLLGRARTISSMNCYPANWSRTITMRARRSRFAIGNIWGVIYDEDNTPLPGANILIKGTTIGTVTDADGKFIIESEEPTATLVISFIGYVTREVDVRVGSDISLTMMADIQSLEEVVVVGYAASERRELTGTVSYLSGRVAGVSVDVVESQKEDMPDVEERREAEMRLYQELRTLNTIRSKFSDIAFWEPRLFTDKKGESKFKITYPDDITRWDAVVYAMNRRLQTGTGRKSVRSYKPIVAELFTPQFLTRGDSSFFIGKVTNYTDDHDIVGKVVTHGTQADWEKDIRVDQSHTDQLAVHPVTTDSVTSSYLFTRDDGYADGEERKVPVVEQGVIRADGTLSFLKNGDDVQVSASPGEIVTVEIMDNPLNIFAGEARYLVNYRYDCNEQLASKLLGLVNYKLIMQYEGKAFKYDKDINKIVRRLLKNQNEEFLWSWWDVSANTSYWMSAHILRALGAAKEAGYDVPLDTENIRRKFEYRVDMLGEYSLADVDLLHALATWNARINYSRHIHNMDSLIVRAEARDRKAKRYSPSYYDRSYLREKFVLQEIRQLARMPIVADTLLRYKKEGILGDIRFSDGKSFDYWYNDELSVNTVAYRVIRREASLRHLLIPLQMYFLEQRSMGAWNTYQSSNIVSTVLPDLLADGVRKGHEASVILSGKVDATINRFPYKLELNEGEQIRVQKKSGSPAYMMRYKMERVTVAKRGMDGFNIRTRWSSGNNDQLLKAGKAIDLIVEVDVNKEADLEHVMIEIPIPGACSYARKVQHESSVETHREYFRDRTVIFCERMTSGKYVFNIHLLPRFTGRYFVNPSQVSLMYFPVINANTEMTKVDVE